MQLTKGFIRAALKIVCRFSFMFQTNVKLSLHSHYRIGGVARYFYEPKTIDEIIAALGAWRAKKLKHNKIFILGGGTNLLIGEKGFNGLVIKPAIRNLSVSGISVTAGAGVEMKTLLEFAAANGLSGLEWAGGLPGTLGGAIRGNAGAFGGEIKDVVAEATSMDITKKSPQLVRRSNNACRFGYRTSIYKEARDGKEIIVEAMLRLKKGEPSAIAVAVAEKIAYRAKNHPMDYPNIGSTFKNVDVKKVPAAVRPTVSHVVKADPFPVVPTAYLISEAGLKGVSCGGAMISPKHPNFIVNTVGATSADVKELIKLIKAQVKKKFGITLEEEIIHL